MSERNAVAAEVLEASAAGYAAAALALLQPPEAAVVSGGDGTTWRAHLLQRVLELAAAVRVEEPALFARRIAWLRRAAVARGADESELRRALLSLRAALEREVPGDLQPLIAPALELALDAFDDVLAPEAIALDAAKPFDRIALRYLAACLEGNSHEAIALVLAEIERGLAPSAAFARVLLPAEKEIGQLWHVGDVSIAEERIVSETTRELMAVIAARYSPRKRNGRSVIAAAVATNAHDIGVRAASDLFRLAGWRCLFLGANVPAAEIARAAETFDVDLVVLNATLATQIKPLGEAVETIRTLAPGRRILVGGAAFDGLPELWRQLGADAFAPSLETVVEVGARLVERLQ